MIKEFSQNRYNVLLNFSVTYCDTPRQLLKSVSFHNLLVSYMKQLEAQDSALYDRLKEEVESEELITFLLRGFNLLLSFDYESILDMNVGNPIFKSRMNLFEFIEGLYNYWRQLERYALLVKQATHAGLQTRNFVEASEDFSNLVLRVYRDIEEHLLGDKHNIYRQLSAGVNANIILEPHPKVLPEEYAFLEDAHIIHSVTLFPPYITYPSMNKREGLFEITNENPLTDFEFRGSHFFCYPAKVGTSLVFVYFHRDFMNHGVSLSNLFELAKPSEYKNNKPDIIYVFGGRLKNNEKRTVYFHDKSNDLYVGHVSNTVEVDYFGYMKKMILTLHNSYMMNKGHLPIHGAMVEITLKNGAKKSLAIVGDSGAGKSESLEAFRTISKEYLKEMKIIFDDMGSFHIEEGNVIGYGTETGAFVRLDDLDPGYPFQVLDRAIVMKPNKINARLLLPVTTYYDITKGYHVDLLLYANNYEQTEKPLTFFSDATSAKKIFVGGKRKAKGTTQEVGIVSSYFANPFGPIQNKEQTDPIIDRVFNQLFDNKIPVGTLYTKLAIEGFEKEGPIEAAKAILKWIEETTPNII